MEPQGKDRETAFCNEHVSCEQTVDCLFSSWGEWSGCSSSCLGVKQRERQIAQHGQGDGAFCRGALKEIYPCNPEDGQDLPDGCGSGPVVDCLLAIWGEWTKCTATCGGGQHSRNRDIVQHPANGGTPCESALSEMQECAIQPCNGAEPVDCAYADWEDWGVCGKCDGERKRLRRILAYASNGGTACEPFATEEVGRFHGIVTTSCIVLGRIGLHGASARRRAAQVESGTVGANFIYRTRLQPTMTVR